LQNFIDILKKTFKNFRMELFAPFRIPHEGLLAPSNSRQGLLSLATEASGACIHIGETAFAEREWCSM